jgi:bifunctional DNase/RNase
MEIPVELVQIIINEQVDQQVIVLRELTGDQRAFPIVIGMPEILAIDRRLKGIELPRP